MTHRNASTVLIAAALMAATIHPNAAADVVALRIRGRCWTAPATVRVTVAVEPNAANRTLRVEMDGDRLFRAGVLTLEDVVKHYQSFFFFINVVRGFPLPLIADEDIEPIVAYMKKAL